MEKNFDFIKDFVDLHFALDKLKNFKNSNLFSYGIRRLNENECSSRIRETLPGVKKLDYSFSQSGSSPGKKTNGF